MNNITLFVKDGFIDEEAVTLEMDGEAYEVESLYSTGGDFKWWEEDEKFPADLEDGEYLVIVHSVEESQAQYGEYGRIEIPASRYPVDYEVSRVGDLPKGYVSEAYLSHLRIEEYKSKSNRIKEVVSERFGGKYLIHSPWGHNITFSRDYSVGPTFKVTKPIMRWKMTDNPADLDEILEFVQSYNPSDESISE